MRRVVPVALAVCLVAACGTLPPSASAPTAALSPDQDPAATDSEPTPEEDRVWRRIELPDADGALNSIAVQGHEVVVVGSLDVDKPMAWSSHDGAWTADPLPVDAGTPTVAIPFGDRIVAAGGMQTSRCAHPAQATFAVRDANSHWTAAPFDRLFCAAGGALHLATSGDVAAVLGTGTGEQPVGWFSHDGLRWVDSGLRGDIFPRALSTERGDFVGLGTTSDGRWSFGRTNGAHGWVFRPGTGLPDGLAIHGLVSGGDGMVAWFGGDQGEDAAFTSPTGELWRRIPQDGLSGTTMLSVRRLGASYFAIAAHADEQLMLASVDALSWRTIPRPVVVQPNGVFRDFAVSDRSMYVLAQTQGDAPVWLMTADLSALVP